MNKIILLIVGLLVIGGIYFTTKREVAAPVKTENEATVMSQNQDNLGNSTTTPDQVDGMKVVLNMIEVSKHNSKESCYSVIESKVYDLTNWIGKHPGGAQAIMSICGKDGTSAFEGQHGASGKPNEVLATFYIGDLVK